LQSKDTSQIAECDIVEGCKSTKKSVSLSKIVLLYVVKKHTISGWFKFNIHQFLPTVPSYATRQASQQRRRHSNITVDFYQILPGTALRSPANCASIFHLCGCGDASMSYVLTFS